jgi:hypothetical protein
MLIKLYCRTAMTTSRIESKSLMSHFKEYPGWVCKSTINHLEFEVITER